MSLTVAPVGVLTSYCFDGPSFRRNSSFSC